MSNRLFLDKTVNSSKTRYFKNPFLESLTYTSALTLNIIFIPLSIFFIFTSFQKHSFAIAIFGIASGLFIWTFIEYVMHRFAFHFKFKNEKLKQFHALFHLSHHQFMQDERKYQTILALSLPSTILYYFLLKSLLGAYVEPVFTGLMIGYVLYEFTHYSTHTRKMDSILVKHLKQHHMHHHFLDQEKNFGVTSALWDIIFNTRLTESDKLVILKTKANKNA
jgi:sterol desaturase/sphingolipid hydroxylase (fatty acid hydroxylase superfamily)